MNTLHDNLNIQLLFFLLGASYNVLDIKLQQYKLMKQIAIANNLPFEDYENLIKKTEKEIFGK